MEPSGYGIRVFNPWAEFNISGQFLCETYGLISPAMPQTAAKIGLTLHQKWPLIITGPNHTILTHHDCFSIH